MQENHKNHLEEINVKIAEMIRIRREEQNLSQKKLSEIAQIDQSMISDYEGSNGFNFNPTIKTLYKLSTALNIPFSKFLKDLSNYNINNNL